MEFFGVQPISPFGEDVPGMVEIKEAHRRWHPHDSHTLSYVEGWATIQVVAEAMGRSLPEHMLSRERVKGVLEGFKDYRHGRSCPTPDHHPQRSSAQCGIENVHRQRRKAIEIFQLHLYCQVRRELEKSSLWVILSDSEESKDAITLNFIDSSLRSE